MWSTYYFSFSLPVWQLVWEESSALSAPPAPTTQLPLIHLITLSSPAPSFKPGVIVTDQRLGDVKQPSPTLDVKGTSKEMIGTILFWPGRGIEPSTSESKDTDMLTPMFVLFSSRSWFIIAHM